MSPHYHDCLQHGGQHADEIDAERERAREQTIAQIPSAIARARRKPRPARRPTTHVEWVSPALQAYVAWADAHPTSVDLGDTLAAWAAAWQARGEQQP